MNAKKIISELNARGAKFVVCTDIMYGKGINGVGFDSYSQYEEFGSSTTTKVYRTFEPKDDYLLIIENYETPEIPWNRAAEKKPYSRRKYIGYDRITYINEYVED